jgi:hypothetical protein
MKFGADRKRLMILGGLALVGGYVLWSNVFSSDSAKAPAAATAPSVSSSATPTVIVPSSQSDAARVAARRGRSERATQWNPGIDRKEIIDPVKVDPTLRLDLLAKVQQVELSGAQRNLFQFGEAEKPVVVATNLPNVPKINVGGKPPQVAPPGPPPVPTAPPIALKYYGYSNPRASTHKRAFFLDGEDIIVASEGEMIKRRYRLVKIGVNSVTMEDTQFKSEQTLPLAEEVAG